MRKGNPFSFNKELQSYPRTPLNLPHRLYFTDQSFHQEVGSLLLTACPLFSPMTNKDIGDIPFSYFETSVPTTPRRIIITFLIPCKQSRMVRL